jgi:hypothetical protein
MVEEAIYQVSQDDEKEVSRQGEKIYEILISDDPEEELEKYYDIAPNSYLKEFAGISYLTREFGDRTINGASLYLKNLNNKRDRIDYQAIVNLYNETCVSFPKCVSLSDSRRKAIKARINSGHNLEDFRTLFQKAEASSFMKGSNQRNWSASFDWMLKDNNFEKVLEGNYDDKDKKQPKTDPNGREYKDGLLVWNIKFPESEHPPYYGAPPEWFENGELVLDRVTAVYQPKDFSVGFYEPKVLTKEDVLEEITFRKEYFAKHGETDG